MILEVLDPRTGGVRTRLRLDTLPLTLGRGYGNDLILDDPYVDARHARIAVDENGALFIEDLGSLNGLAIPGAPSRVPRIALERGTQVRLGHTTLRFRDPEEPVPAALPARSDLRMAVPQAPSWLATRPRRLVVSAAATVAILGYVWLGNYGRSRGSHAFEATLAFLVSAALWAGIWAIASRIVVHRFHFTEHFAVASALTLAILGLIGLAQWVVFLFPDNRLWTPFSQLAALALVAALVAGHLAFASSLARARRWRVGLVTSAILLTLSLVSRLATRESFSDVPEFSGMLKPVPARWIPAGTLAGFGRVAAELKDRADALAAEQ